MRYGRFQISIFKSQIKINNQIPITLQRTFIVIPERFNRESSFIKNYWIPGQARNDGLVE
jgi:hypothetical protein